MDLIFKKDITVEYGDVNEYGRLKLSALLRYAQEISGNHSDRLGFDWDTLANKGLFWAVLRHRVVIHRLPAAGESLHLETWPMPATRAAYPRAVRALDNEGNILFETVALWVLMKTENRTMVLPGRSGVEVPGILRGDEPASPSSLAPGAYPNSLLWTVGPEDLDINNHVNNAKYLDHVEVLAADCNVKEFTVCYLAETLLGQEITLQWELSEDGLLQVDGLRWRTDVPGEKERVFSVRLAVEKCSVNQAEL